MRVSEDRYSRDLRRINLAQRLIRLEARTHTIRVWTGLSDERVRNLYRSYTGSDGPLRHRGPSPRRVLKIMRSPGLHCEASAVGALAHVVGLIPAQPLANAQRALPTVSNGEKVCHVFELFRHVVPQARFTIDQFILLVTALAEGVDFEMGHCTECHAALLIDRYGATRRLCLWCRRHADKQHEPPEDADSRAYESDVTAADKTDAGGIQQSLF
jgi:hypothetical protein